MSPLLKDGDKILVDIREKNYSLGDIILTMDKKHELICHRVISLNPILTKGDRNLYIDQTVSIIGKVIYVKKKNGYMNLNANKLLNSIQAVLCKKNIHENRYRKVFLFLLFLLSMYELKTGKKSVEGHTPTLE